MFMKRLVTVNVIEQRFVGHLFQIVLTKLMEDVYKESLDSRFV